MSEHLPFAVILTIVSEWPKLRFRIRSGRAGICCPPTASISGVYCRKLFTMRQRVYGTSDVMERELDLSSPQGILGTRSHVSGRVKWDSQFAKSCWQRMPTMQCLTFYRTVFGC